MKVNEKKKISNFKMDKKSFVPYPCSMNIVAQHYRTITSIRDGCLMD